MRRILIRTTQLQNHGRPSCSSINYQRLPSIPREVVEQHKVAKEVNAKGLDNIHESWYMQWWR
ncbi:hypothetical protein DPMN_123110 [Dreissena polymorpha]|uniref:Uncharacterized protein n=1 Tax=Dreissena polymorpha TaxID=45954 RepID=A0A9D4JV26_DREPO|nr:hypothetical protein DPMN_123110 [Dreissena polymorpha]